MGDFIFKPFWEAIFRLERIGLKVLATSFDGASVNRKMVKVHDSGTKVLYEALNIYAKEERYIYYFSDPRHLIKTIIGKDISWSHLMQLYDIDKGKGSGLAMVPKFKYEHVFSESVGKALCLAVGTKAEETTHFVLIFYKFFDILNWLENVFFPYLEEWETSVNNRAQFSGAEKRQMLLSS
uniref:Uncharacterized protein n=1 Tax=Amphimedon queenslandica TaxID=400682 RepID=A0A1X7VDZ1_AMPQE